MLVLVLVLVLDLVRAEPREAFSPMTTDTAHVTKHNSNLEHEHEHDLVATAPLCVLCVLVV